MQRNGDAQLGIRPGGWDAQNLGGFWDTNESSNLASRQADPVNVNKTQREPVE